MTSIPGEPQQLAKTTHPLPTDVPAIAGIAEWLGGDASHDLDAVGFVAGLGDHLRNAGFPLDRLVLHQRTLHAEIRGRTMVWTPDAEVQVHDREHGVELTAAFTESPLPRMIEMRKPVVVRLDERNAPAWNHIDVLNDTSLVEFFFVPLFNAHGPVATAFFCTRQPEGFAPMQRAGLERIAPALRNACELRALRTIVLSMLDTYVGPGSAQRILAGHVRRGEVESLDVALMLCDLRGFTQMSNRLPSERVIELLNDYFDCVVPAIAESGGEVLKFIGDAVLAFFHDDDAATACAAAIAGALRAFERLDQFSAPDAELHAGIALHYGKVSYGNIGSGHRLDFTLIGSDVNLVSRIQTVCGSTGNRLLMSERFADLLGASRATTIGNHNLKGFADPVPLYTLIE